MPHLLAALVALGLIGTSVSAAAPAVFDQGESIGRFKVLSGHFRQAKLGLTFEKGAVSRRFDQQVRNTPGPNADRGDCMPADHPRAESGDCGSRSIKEEPSGLSVIPYREHSLYGQGSELAHVNWTIVLRRLHRATPSGGG